MFWPGRFCIHLHHHILYVIRLLLQFDWLKLAKGTMDYVNIAIDENEPINVVAIPYFEKFMDVVNKYRKR